MPINGVGLKSLCLIKWKGGEYRLINKVSSKWHSFGLRLDIPYDQLEVWRVELLGSREKCWLRVMQHWLDGRGPPDYPPTWNAMASIFCCKMWSALRLQKN